MSKKVNLGRKPGIEIHSLSDVMKETRYPDLHISDVPEALELPDEGKCIIEYKMVNRSHSPGEKKDHCSVTLEIRSLEPSGKSYYSKNGNGKKDADGGVRKSMDKYFKEQDEK